MVYRIEEMFPDLRVEGQEDNILLQTIRVPRKLLSLTNRLPKPNYDADENEMHSRHTTIASYLPEIGNRKSLQHRGYHSDKQDYKKIFGQYAKLVPINISKINPTLKVPKILEKAPLRGRQEQAAYENSIKERSMAAENSVHEDCEYSPDFEDADERVNPQLHKPKKLKQLPKKLPSPTHNLQEERKKQDVIKLLHDKYVRKHPAQKQSIEAVPRSYIGRSVIEQSEQYLPSPVVKHIVGRRNHAERQNNHNVQRLANIYSCSPQQLSLVAQRLQSLKRPKLPLKYNERNVAQHLRPKQAMGNNNEGRRLNGVKSSKAKLEPLKLLSYEDDIQAIRIEPLPLYPNSRKS